MKLKNILSKSKLSFKSKNVFGKFPTKYTLESSKTLLSVRFLNIHEYQSKELMDKYGVKTQKWRLATAAKQAKKGAEELNCKEYVVKAQIHAGGRGKGTFENGFQGGVHLCKTPEQAEELTMKMLGQKLVTKQTGGKGVLVEKVMIAEAINIVKETYFSILMDRAFDGPVMVGSPKGGMDIEAVAHETPEAIFKEGIDIEKGPTREQTLRMAKNLGFEGPQLAEAQKEIEKLYTVFIKTDAVQVEINPFAQTDTGDIVSADAKMNFDDNAYFKQPTVFAYRDTAEEDPLEVEAGKFNLNYVAMDGNIGCMVNGAGLAMATMDIIKLYGGEPANFLDVGGSASAKQVTEAFRIITSDSKVKAILVNIFGGIMRCDVIAEGIIEAAKTINLKVPLVVRLAGTNVEKGKELLQKSGLTIIPASDLDEAAQKVVNKIK
eukprot:TRINITY_DN1238_c0_g1_i1.p1 TRINITY_DN1238_c0_g1~~TRINITY_DN1238_c0_g1_i1.p1  ORF type:complete len:434 (-),score=151.32 TRINITY_DN1238_c0_g1_i1:48-1349(-)